ncbi:YncE family protein [Chitinophaga sp. CF418]|uniref:YncE family protein n=1 Tax=Chitinophaga sp. CF418 TaxID=1855287 RepID=UPI00091BCF67|nr:YncE family protein [Chitinophaga sp. CF418]SHN42426.1 DNA-binding beta-propeller fold protein YncE [Chitinophaga sp. CF418]
MRCLVLLLGILGLSYCTTQAQSADLLVVNKIKTNGNIDGNLAFVNLTSGKVVKTIPVGKEPHEVTVSADRHYAIVSNTGSYQEPGNTLSVIDIAAQKEIHRVDLGPLWNPHGLIAINGLFYFTAEGARMIGAYDPASNKIVWLNGTGQDGTHTLAATRDGKYLVSTNRGSGTISIFYLHKQRWGNNNNKADNEEEKPDPLAAGSWQETIVPVGRNPEGIAVSPDDKQVWVGLKNGEGVAIVDLAQQKKVDSFLVDGAKQLSRLKFSLDGKYVLGTDNWPDGNLVIIDAASHKVVKTISLGMGAEAIFIEPDGRHVLVGVTGKDNVAEIDLQTMTISRRFETGKGPDGMAWIGNGK